MQGGGGGIRPYQYPRKGGNSSK